MKSNMAGECLGVKYPKSMLLMCEQLAEITTCRHTHSHTYRLTDTHTFKGDLWGSKEQLKMRHWTMYDRSMGMSLWLLRKAQCSYHNSEWWRVWPERQCVCVCACACVCVPFVCEGWPCICTVGFKHRCLSLQVCLQVNVKCSHTVYAWPLCLSDRHSSTVRLLFWNS